MSAVTTPLPAATNVGELLAGAFYGRTFVADTTGADGLGAVTASPAVNTLLGRLKAIQDLLTLTNGYVDGIEGFVDGVEALIGSTNTALATLNGYTDGQEGLLTDLKVLLTTQAGYVDGLEALIGNTNTLLATQATYVDGLEGLITATNAALATVGTRAYGTPAPRLAVTSASAQTGALTLPKGEVALSASVRMFIAIGANPTATTDGIVLEAGTANFHLQMPTGQKIAALRDTADGFLNIVPVA